MVSYNVAGEIVTKGKGSPTVKKAKATTGGSAIAKGVGVIWDITNKRWNIATAGDKGQAGVCVETTVDSDPKVEVAEFPNTVTMTAGGAISIRKYVKFTTGGKVIAWVNGVDALDLAIGIYVENTNNADPNADCALNDVIAVEFLQRGAYA